MRKVAAMLVAGVLATLGADAGAAQLTLSLGPVAAYANATSFPPVPLYPTSSGKVYEFPIQFRLSGLTAGQSFGSITLDVTLGGAFVPDVQGGPYARSTAAYTSGKSQVPYYSVNADQGTIPIDLKEITASFPAGPATPQRAAAGVGSDFLIGYVYFDHPTGATTGGSIKITATQWSLNDNGVLVAQPNDAIAQLPTYSLTLAGWLPPVPEAPEPGGALVAAVAGLVLTTRRGKRERRRQVPRR